MIDEVKPLFIRLAADHTADAKSEFNCPQVYAGINLRHQQRSQVDLLHERTFAYSSTCGTIQSLEALIIQTLDPLTDSVVGAVERRFAQNACAIERRSFKRN